MADLIPADTKCPALEKGTPHRKCLSDRAKGYPQRQNCGSVAWSEPNPDYRPVPYTAESIKKQPAYADGPQPNLPFKSYEGPVREENGFPLNPRGRTGICERGRLGRWGANFAADPILTRVRKGQFELLAIRRGDTGEWALPGGMVDGQESLAQTLSRELAEEALGETKSDRFRELFETRGLEIYRGYVDDPRNTDNAWLESGAVHLHLSEAEADFEPVAGDDANHAQWTPIERDTLKNFYAVHGEIVTKAILEWQAISQQRLDERGQIAPGTAI